MTAQNSTTAFSSSYEKWNNELWSLVHFLKTENEEYQEDYLEVFLALRRNFLRSRLFRTKWDSLYFVKKFMDLWRSRVRIISKRQGVGLEQGVEESQFVGQTILYVLANKTASLADLSMWLGISQETLKKKAFDALLDFQKVPFSDRKYLERNCVRNDLYHLNLVLEYEWKDPLQLYTKKDHLNHSEKCLRCFKINKFINEALVQLRNIEKRRMPPEFKELLNSEMNSSLKIVSFDSLALWPWYLKTPVQMALVGLVLFSLMNLPYVGDMYPGFDRSQKRITSVLSSSFDVVKKGALQIGEFTDRARQNIYEKWVSARKLSLEKPVVIPEVVSPVEEQIVATLPEVPTPEPKIAQNVQSEQSLPIVPKPVLENPVTPKQITAKVSPQPVEEDLQNAKIFYRWGAFSKDLQVQTSQILELLQKFSAFKAGDLELGAAYKGGSYFHFSVKEENLQPLIVEMRKIGLVDFTQSSAKSDRVTEKGFKRVVFLLAPSK